ncbi:MAG: PTPA-CTERM sorting domain-containing protein [Deltaproteobacteria bacterium]|nr:PTPA-CTERM sorting domain-containing protein [Deltaproteobacteria bacterium]
MPSLLLLVAAAHAASPSAPGDLIISEFLAEPRTVPNYWGEWFEVHNPTDGPIDLLNLTIETDDEPGFTVSSSLIVPAGGYVVFGIDGNTARNGGVSVDYVYGDGSGLDVFQLDHRADSIRLKWGTTTIDALTWDSSGSWRLEVEDNSYQVNRNALGLEWANDLPQNWCDSDVPFGSLYATPGEANSNCPDFGRDTDGDGYTPATGDCDDSDPDVNPDAIDGARSPYGEANDDADCDGVRDDGTTDDDGDGYAEVEGDCDDGDTALRPGAPELDDGLDNDCNGCADDFDLDGDGFTPCAPELRTDGEGWDCDDTDASVNPDAREVAYDAVDQDCDGEDACDLDDDGFYASPEVCVDGVDCCAQDGSPGADCDDTSATVSPAGDEGDPAAGGIPDGADNDCNGVVDDPYLDRDGDGLSVADGDCRDAPADEDPDAPSVFPGAVEACGDAIDNDCNGLVDDGCSTPTALGALSGGGLCAAAGGAPAALLPSLFVLGLAALRRRQPRREA